MRHGAAAAGLQRQTRLRAVERLNLALLIDRQHHRVGGWIEIETDDVGQFLGEARIIRPLEGAHPVRLQLGRLPDPLHRAQRDAGDFRHRPSRPMRHPRWRLGAGQRNGARPSRSPIRSIAPSVSMWCT